jgi:hypothetical protein
MGEAIRRQRKLAGLWQLAKGTQTFGRKFHGPQLLTTIFLMFVMFGNERVFRPGLAPRF